MGKGIKFLRFLLCIISFALLPTMTFAYAYDTSTAYDCGYGGFPMRFAGCLPGYYYEDWQNADDSIIPENVGECIECPTNYDCPGGFSGPVSNSPCSTGYYGTTAQSCTACTNGPAHSTYTSSATTNSCS